MDITEKLQLTLKGVYTLQELKRKKERARREKQLLVVDLIIDKSWVSDREGNC